jgi:SAM-dependent methyltransferase
MSITSNLTIPNSRCNLCGYPIVKLPKIVFGDLGKFAYRCIKCKSSLIHRAIGYVFSQVPTNAESKIYELSAHGAFYKYLQPRFPYLTTSDFIPGVRSGLMYKGRTIQDVEHLTYFNETFDVVTSTEVFEHVADDARGYREVLRVLKPGGIFVFTVPVNGWYEKTVERAYRNEKNEVVDILEPEYHGDYMGKGILAFRNYGTDLVDKLKMIGFSDVQLYKVTTQFNLDSPVFKCTK